MSADPAEKILVFSRGSSAGESAPQLPGGYVESVWRPSLASLYPPGAPRFLPHTLMHFAGLFANRDYGVYVIRKDGALVHHSCIQPRDFRFPFMSPDDLQIGVVETVPEHRGKGLARHAIEAIVHDCSAPGRRFWYIVEAGNGASIKAAQNAGFALAGTTVKRARMGVRALGSYHFTPNP